MSQLSSKFNRWAPWLLGVLAVQVIWFLSQAQYDLAFRGILFGSMFLGAWRLSVALEGAQDLLHQANWLMQLQLEVTADLNTRLARSDVVIAQQRAEIEYLRRQIDINHKTVGAAHIVLNGRK